MGLGKELFESVIAGGPLLLAAADLIPYRLAVLLYGWLILGCLLHRSGSK